MQGEYNHCKGIFICRYYAPQEPNKKEEYILSCVRTPFHREHKTSEVELLMFVLSTLLHILGVYKENTIIKKDYVCEDYILIDSIALSRENTIIVKDFYLC